jgi:hypothetical protein
VVLNVHVQTPTKRHRIPFVLSDTIVNILRWFRWGKHTLRLILVL